MHYFLPSPLDSTVPVVKRGSRGDAPIFHCETTNTFWLLKMDVLGNRYLFRYYIDGRKPAIDLGEYGRVPKDWTGEPIDYEIDEEALRSGFDDRTGAYALDRGIGEFIANGDRVLVTRDDRIVIGYIARRDDGMYEVLPLDRR